MFPHFDAVLFGHVAVLSLLFAGALAEFSSQCRSIKLIPVSRWNHWLYAECPDDSGALVQSTAFLAHWIINNDSHLEFPDSPPPLGGSYAGSCESGSCSLDLTTGAFFQCNCPGYDGSYHISALNLDEHFVNSNGTLKCDILGPVVSGPHSDLLVPDPMGYTFAVTEDTGCTLNGYAFTDAAMLPLNCFDLTGANPEVAGHFGTNPGWQLLAFADNNCAGQIVGTIGPDDGDQCVIFSERAFSISILPLWNAI